MENINNLKEKEKEILELMDIIKTENKFKNIKDFATFTKLKSLENELLNIREKIKIINIERGKEIIELRLIGNKVNYGSIPLEIIGDITKNIALALIETSKFISFGNKRKKNKDKIVKDIINLRLEGIGTGSTIFYISSTTTPDLFGNSLIQNTLDNYYQIINITNMDNITEEIGNIGKNGLKYLSNFLNQLNKEDLEVELKWKNIEMVENVWNGSKENILQLYNNFNQVEFLPPETINLNGELKTISAKGKFEILTEDSRTIYARFPIELLEKMEEFHINQNCNYKMYKNKVKNRVTNKEKIEYNLINIEKL